MIPRVIFLGSLVDQAILLQAPQQPGGPPPAASLPMLPPRAQKGLMMLNVRGRYADKCRIIMNSRR